MKVSNIEASLSLGRFFSGKWIAVIYFCLFASLLFPAITIILLAIPAEYGVIWDIGIIATYIFMNLLSLFLMIVVIWVIKNNNKIKKKIQLCFDDAIELKAFSKVLDIKRFLLQPKIAKIETHFNLNGVSHKRVSSNRVVGAGNLKGYHNVFNNYINKQIKILYSQKYDEVLILKDKVKSNRDL